MSGIERNGELGELKTFSRNSSPGRIPQARSYLRLLSAAVGAASLPPLRRGQSCHAATHGCLRSYLRKIASPKSRAVARSRPELLNTTKRR
jgi:hypothetical protein